MSGPPPARLIRRASSDTMLDKAGVQGSMQGHTKETTSNENVSDHKDDAAAK